MKGSLRFITGLILVFGAVGGMDHQPEGNLALQTLGAIVGLGLILWASKDLDKA